MEITPQAGAEAGRLIGEALADRVLRKQDSQRAAAARAGISDAWWRQVVNGGQNRSGVWVPAVGSLATYMAMAKAVGVDEGRILDVLGVPEDERLFPDVPLGEYVAESGPTVEAGDDVLTRLNARVEQMEKDIAEMKRERS